MGDSGSGLGRHVTSAVAGVRSRRPSVNCEHVESALTRSCGVTIGSGHILEVYHGGGVRSCVGRQCGYYAGPTSSPTCITRGVLGERFGSSVVGRG